MIASSQAPSPPRVISRDASEPTQQIIREPLFGDGERITLPYRQLGEAKKYGWFGVGAGVFATLFMIGWIGGPLAIGVGLIMDGHLFGALPIAFSFLGIMGLRFAILMLAGGWAVTKDRTRTVIEVRGEKLTTIEEFYGLKWKRKCKLKRIEQLAHKTKWDNKSESDHPSLDEIGGALVATQAGEQPFPVAVGYPREILMELAESLATQFNTVQVAEDTLRTDRESNSETQIRNRVEVVELAPESVEPVEKPSDTDLELTQHDAGIKIDLPPTGFGSFIGSFSILWLAITTMFLFTLIFGKANEPVWVGWLIVSLFAAVGICMFLWAFNSGRRRTSLVTAGDRVLLVSEAPLGKSRREWSKDQLYEIRVGDSNVSVNDEPIRELQFHDRAKKKVGCLSERTDDELRWIAYELNSALGMKPVLSRPIQLAEVARDVDGRVIPSFDSLITVDYRGDSGTISVPGRGLKKFIGFVVNGLVFVLLGVGMSALFIWYERSVMDVIIPVVFGALFSLAGLTLLIYSLVLAQRGFVFEVELNALQVRRTGWLSEKSLRWNRDELRSVAVKHSGTKIGNRSLYHLKIAGNNKSVFCGMTDHSIEDLSFVAVAINEMMSLDSES